MNFKTERQNPLKQKLQFTSANINYEGSPELCDLLAFAASSFMPYASLYGTLIAFS